MLNTPSEVPLHVKGRRFSKSFFTSSPLITLCIQPLFVIGVLSSLSLNLSAVAAEPPPPAPTMVFFGDSITAGYGLSPAEAYPALIEEELRQKGHAIHAVNAGNSGDTTATGIRRLAWVLKQKPKYFVIALGGNDMLRGIPVVETEKNLRQIIEDSRKAGSLPILLGMKALPNLGKRYVEQFEAMFTKVAKSAHIPFLPFYIEDVAGKPSLNQPDGIHPTAEGQKKIAARVVRFLLPLLGSAGAKS